MNRILWTTAVLLVPAALRADEIFLRAGGRISGEIVERTESSVTVDIGAGTMAVEMVYVERIESGASAVGQYKERAARIGSDDAEEWRELARWAERQGLNTQARDAYERVLAVVPGDPEANRALGLVELDGQWVSEEESYRARGYVEFEGEWMTAEQQRSILEERAAEERERADREAREAEERADQQAREDAEWSESQSYGYGVPVYGDPVYWGWGAGPTVWPSQPGRRPQRPARPATLPAQVRR